MVSRSGGGATPPSVMALLSLLCGILTLFIHFMTDLHNLWLNGNMYTMKGGPVVQFVLALFTSFVFKRYFRSQVFVKADFKLTLQQHRCLAVMPSFIQQNYPPAAISIILLFILNSQ